MSGVKREKEKEKMTGKTRQYSELELTLKALFEFFKPNRPAGQLYSVVTDIPCVEEECVRLALSLHEKDPLFDELRSNCAFKDAVLGKKELKKKLFNLYASQVADLTKTIYKDKIKDYLNDRCGDMLDESTQNEGMIILEIYFDNCIGKFSQMFLDLEAGKKVVNQKTLAAAIDSQINPIMNAENPLATERDVGLSVAVSQEDFKKMFYVLAKHGESELIYSIINKAQNHRFPSSVKKRKPASQGSNDSADGDKERDKEKEADGDKPVVKKAKASKPVSSTITEILSAENPLSPVTIKKSKKIDQTDMPDAIFDTNTTVSTS